MNEEIMRITKQIKSTIQNEFEKYAPLSERKAHQAIDMVCFGIASKILPLMQRVERLEKTLAAVASVLHPKTPLPFVPWSKLSEEIS